MFLISHRGNTNGINKDEENQIDYIKSAINKGFDVEIDVRTYKNKLYLGHDTPEVLIDDEFLKNNKLWCHAKDLNALNKLNKIKSHFFWHQEDDVTITNKGFFWTYPGKQLFKKSICVLPEKASYKKFKCFGICSDYIVKYKKKLNK